MRRHYTSKQRSDVVDLVTTGRATVSEAAARMGRDPFDGVLLDEARGRGGANAIGAVLTRVEAARARRADVRPARAEKRGPREDHGTGRGR